LALGHRCQLAEKKLSDSVKLDPLSTKRLVPFAYLLQSLDFVMPDIIADFVTETRKKKPRGWRDIMATSKGPQ